MSVGFFFSLGHSTIVFSLAFLFALGIKALNGQVRSSASQLHNVTTWIGTVSRGRSCTRSRRSHRDPVGHRQGLPRNAQRTLRRGAARAPAQLARTDEPLLRRFTKTITKPWQMYPLGMLFGLGFDTASEVALLFLAAGRRGGPPVLRDPVPAGAVRRRHESARHDRRLVHELRLRLGVLQAVRKVFYNLTITGCRWRGAGDRTIEIVGLLAQKLNAQGSFWRGGRTSTSTRSASSSSACSSPPGRSRWRSGAWVGSRSAGRSTSRRARA